MQSDAPTLDADDEDDEQDGSSDESSDGEPVIPLATGREKRINQGNRMRALLEEEGLIEDEELFREEEDDVDFQAKGVPSRRRVSCPTASVWELAR